MITGGRWWSVVLFYLFQFKDCGYSNGFEKIHRWILAIREVTEIEFSRFQVVLAGWCVLVGFQFKHCGYSNGFEKIHRWILAIREVTEIEFSRFQVVLAGRW